MSDLPTTPDEPKDYAVRLSERASRDIEQAVADYLDFAENASKARRMFLEMRKFAGRLYWFPDGYAVNASFSQAFGFDVRTVTYRLSKGSSVAYHFVYHITEDGEDGAMVVVLCVRHAARATLTKAEAREILAQQ